MTTLKLKNGVSNVFFKMLIPCKPCGLAGLPIKYLDWSFCSGLNHRMVEMIYNFVFIAKKEKNGTRFLENLKILRRNKFKSVLVQL